MQIKERINVKSISGINWKCTTLYFDKVNVHLYFCSSPEKPEMFSSSSEILQEAERQNWGKGYTVRFDKMNYGVYDPNKDHLHIYKKNNELLAINRDGTAHDKSHGARIPNYVADKIRVKYPDFVVPENNVLESIESNNILSQEEILYLLDIQKQYKQEILNG